MISNFLIIVANAIFCLASFATTQPDEAETQTNESPNVLVFLVDDMGIQDTSQPFLYDEAGQPIITDNNRLLRTPNMESLAKSGRLFTNAYAYSVCSPTRVTLLTGQSAIRHRVTTWTHPTSFEVDTGKIETELLEGPPWNTRGVPSNVPLLPQLMRQQGYQTIFAGKAHFGPNDTPNGDPTNLGFDINIAGHGAGGPGSYHGEKNFSATWRGGGELWDVPGLNKYHGTETFLTEALTQEMSKAIRDSVKSKKPFFAFMSHYAVHAPFETDSRFADNYPQLKGKPLAFATLVEGMDRSLGDLIKTLNDTGVAENTLIVFLSDNGSDSPMGSKPLRGKKGTRFEGGIKVPMIVAWAKPNPTNALQKNLPIPTHTIESSMVSCQDIMPTLLSIAGIQIPQNATIDGHDLSNHFQGKSPGNHPQEFTAHFPHGRHNNSLFSLHREGDYKIIFNYSNEEWELFDLANDPFESTNLVEQDPQRALSLAKAMIRKLEFLDAQFPLNRKSKKPVRPNLMSIQKFLSD